MKYECVITSAYFQGCRVGGIWLTLNISVLSLVHEDTYFKPTISYFLLLYYLFFYAFGVLKMHQMFSFCAVLTQIDIFTIISLIFGLMSPYFLLVCFLQDLKVLFLYLFLEHLQLPSQSLLRKLPSCWWFRIPASTEMVGKRSSHRTKENVATFWC